MEPANIDWKKVDSRFVRDDVYERIDAPKWADLSAPYSPGVDDDAWFCRPDCRHPKTIEDFQRCSPSPKVKQMRCNSEVLPLSERKASVRDGNLKRRGGIAPIWSSSSTQDCPNPKTSSKKFREDLENQDPNLPVAAVSRTTANSSTTPSPRKPKGASKIAKEAIKSSAEKRGGGGEEKVEDLQQKKPTPRLRSTLSARNLFAGKDILAQISEFCNEIKKMVTMKERANAEEVVVKEEKDVLKESVKNVEVEERRGIDLNMNTEKKDEPVKKGGRVAMRVETKEACKIDVDENSPLLNESVRACPPTPQRFPSPSIRRQWSTRAPKLTSSPLNKPSQSKTLRGVLEEKDQSRQEKRALVAVDEEHNRSIGAPETEGRSVDVFWFLKPCTYLAK